MRIVCLAVVLLLGAGTAAADTPRERADALVAEGAKLGSEQRFAEAIARFREAEALFSRAIHQCNIALAYRFWGRLPEADLYLKRCTTRATEALPKWVGSEQARVTKALTRGRYTPVVVSVSPVGARVRIDGFAEGAEFAAPLTVWAPHGQVRITARLDGFGTVRRTAQVRGDTPIRVSIALRPATTVLRRLEPLGPRDGELEVGVPRAIGARVQFQGGDRGPWGWVTLGVGVGLAGLGGAMHALAVSEQDKRFAPGDPGLTDSQRAWDGYVGAMGASYALSAAAISIGIWLLVRDVDDTPVYTDGTPYDAAPMGFDTYGAQ